MRNTSTAVMWLLTAPSVSGGKEYRVLLFDKYTVIGWGPIGGTMQYKVHQEPTAELARVTALSLTQLKEIKGYSLTVGPLRSRHPADYWDKNLPPHISLRGGSPFFDSAFRGLLSDGVMLSE